MNQKKMRYQQHPLNERTDNCIKAFTFQHPKWIPCGIGCLPSTWIKYGRDLEKIHLEHPRLHPNFKEGDGDPETILNNLHPSSRKGFLAKDNWGCLYETLVDGIAGETKGFPLEDWVAFDNYRVPNPLTEGTWSPTYDWVKEGEQFAKRRKNGWLPQGRLEHGFFFLRLTFLRGFQNYMIDVAMNEPRLVQLEEQVCDFCEQQVRKWVELGAECIMAGEDLGTQKALPMSREHFLQHIIPYYRRIFAPCRENGLLAFLHSDGHILPIIEDLIECGVNIINPQVRANTLPGLARFKGKVAIHLDLDRQLFPFVTPAQIKDHVKECIDALYLPEGGLSLNAECAPDVPLVNIAALHEILDELAGPWMNWD